METTIEHFSYVISHFSFIIVRIFVKRSIFCLEPITEPLAVTTASLAQPR